MDSQITTMSTKGQLVIPAEMRALLGLQPGDRIALTLEDSRIILQPVNDKFVDQLRGMFSGKPSMADELQQERRQDKW